MFGLFGTVLSGIQTLSYTPRKSSHVHLRLAVDRTKLEKFDWNINAGKCSPVITILTITAQVVLFLGFTMAMFLFYYLVPKVIASNGAVFLNLSLLTADVYSLLFGLFLFNFKVEFCLDEAC